MADNPYIKKLIRDEVRALSAYHVPDASGYIKLDAMENPYQLPAELVDEWLDVLREVELNRYPDPGARPLKAQLRKAMQIPADMELLLGNGSDEIIQMICMALAKPGATVLAPEPGFVMYRMIALFCNMDYIGVPLHTDFSLDMDAMRAAIEEHRPAVTFLAWPNNPTGNLFSETDVMEIIEHAPGLVVLDEAYTSFAGQSFMARLGDYDNLVVMRTVSKSGLAGLRLGYLAGPAAWLNEFDKVRLPYNINILTQASAEFVLSHTDVLDAQAAKLRAARGELFTAMQAIDGIEPYPSAANFILFRTPAGQATAIFESLKAQNVLVKNMQPVGGMLADCLRVTVSTPQENTAFLTALRDSLAG
ncbi:histidinol-phosphate transaminase [Sulfuriflexus mobilis]|uniref:histidinol-phosphate transaminase n=1 Tax=Sulfuriflexus mobilis TaxID=1811807 RepID=UPI000F8349B8|nr:histidinol-phosphate transaminase [Sulfuriflexus mobilis]